MSYPTPHPSQDLPLDKYYSDLILRYEDAIPKLHDVLDSLRNMSASYKDVFAVLLRLEARRRSCVKILEKSGGTW